VLRSWHTHPAGLVAALLCAESELDDADHLTSEKTGNGPASRTSVALTNRGRAALDAYTETLRGLLNGLLRRGRL